VSEALHLRARRMRQRLSVRAWEYRQRHHAKGVWHRLRRVLADAAAAYVIPDEQARRLLDEGLPAEPVGQELQPPKTLIFVTPSQLASITERQEIPVTLGVELLTASAIALVRFP
jgi:hypothetical protein